MRCLDDDRGSQAVSSVLLFPVAVLLIFAIFHGAVFMFGRNAALHAANGGVQAAATRAGNLDVARDAAAGRLARTGDGVLDRTSIRASGDATSVTVTVTGEVESMIPFVGPWQVSATATAPIERFTTPGAP